MKKIALVVLGVFSILSQADACTRTLFVGSGDVVITGRSMDWMEDMQSDLWVFPRGMKRNGASGQKSISWTSKYGSVIVSGYNVASADGMNEKGLVANLLYLTESDYGKPSGDKPLLSISLWAQFALDNFSRVADAVKALRQEPFQILAPKMPNGSGAQLHLSLSDPTGDSAIIEYVDGKQVIHHGKQYQVMTNSPTYEKQLALNEYWEEIGGLVFLPGTFRAADRFARASFYNSAIPKKMDPHYSGEIPNEKYVNQALASVIGVIRSVSVPLGISDKDKPNLASTLWRTFADHKNKIYYFDSATTPNVFWVDLKDLNFNEGAPAKKLKGSESTIYAGNTASSFVEAKPFEFLPAKP